MSDTKREEIEKMVEETSPHDGFKVKDNVFANDHSLHIGFYHRGVPVQPPWLNDGPLIEVWRKQDPADADYGEKVRLRLVLEAMLRFLNTGGEWTKLAEAINVVHRVSGGGIHVTAIPGYHLISSYVNTSGVYEHLFAADDSPFAVRWVEGEFIDVVPLTDVRNEQLAQDEEYELTHGTLEPTAADQGAGTDLPRLTGPDAAESAADEPEQDIP